ncbi:hypothetical protein CRE_29830 [Caenorhabditis remanei]|uniref:Uncharacterized protein n=1 Tax=Caenorhabditis remanei TaxID=31234 RepID=E3LVZ9_CAERE|nr:hypothetical protein CRE_29830 [Caenorhabditis remanei]
MEKFKTLLKSVVDSALVNVYERLDNVESRLQRLENQQKMKKRMNILFSNDDASWDTLINDSFDKFVQGLEKEFRENAEFRKEVLRHERWRVAKKREQIKRNVSEQKQEWAEKQAYAKLQRMRELKKLKKRRKDQRKKVMKIRRQTWIAFRIFVMIFLSEIK